MVLSGNTKFVKSVDGDGTIRLFVIEAVIRKRSVLDHLHTTRARALQKAMLDARELFDAADERYQRALAAAMNPDAGMDGLQAVRREGRAYAQALTEYSNAAMTWLTYVDARPQSKKATGKE